MLEQLSVRGLGIIDAVELRLDRGFSVLTGETGAGKSLLVESLKLLAGQRAQSDLVRTGDDRLSVEAVFVVDDNPHLDHLLSELGIEPGRELIIRRELTAAGRSRCWINDITSKAGSLQRLAPHLLAIHGQHEQHGLSDPSVQRGLVDDYGDHHELLGRTRAAFDAWYEAATEVDRLRAARASRRDRLDVIAFQIHEIDAVDPRDGEDETLRTRRLVVRHAARLAELSSAIVDRLDDGDHAVVDGLAKAERDLQEMAECGLDVDGAGDLLRDARTRVEEVVREIRGHVDDVSIDPGELDALESRLHALEQLMLKYGGTIAEVIEHRNRLLGERAELDSVADRLEQAAATATVRLAEFDRHASELDEVRREVGAALARDVEAVLARLEMSGTRLEFEWRTKTEAASPLLRDGQPVAFDGDGVAECELMIAANPGEALRPMARVASGGELSRLHLALRTVLRQRRAASGLTLLFDEVDSGLGGSTAAALAELLSDLAAADQVLAVTHLPQVAARAGSHFAVSKAIRGGRATTEVARLEDADRETEVARMLAGGTLTDSAHAHARVLLSQS